MSALLSFGEAVLGSGLLGGSDGPSKTLARKQYRLQNKIAHEGIRMRVADAKAAGIHPLYALGAGTPTASATPIMDGDPGRNTAEAAIRAGTNFLAKREAEKRQAWQDDLYNSQVQSQIKANNALANLRTAQTGETVQRALLASQAARLKQNADRSPSSIVLPSGSEMAVGLGDSAELVEQEYGGAAGEITGGYRFLRDTGRHAGKIIGNKYGKTLGTPQDYRNSRKRILEARKRYGAYK